LIQIFYSHLRNRRALAPSRIVDQETDGTVGSPAFADKGFNILVAREIRGQYLAVAAHSSNFLLNFFELGRGAGSQKQPTAGASKRESNRFADTSACARDERDFAVERAHEFFADKVIIVPQLILAERNLRQRLRPRGCAAMRVAMIGPKRPP
jgi:hypothetical protein